MATGIQTGMQRGSRSGISRGSALGKGAPGAGGGGPFGKIKEIWDGLSKGMRIGISSLAIVLFVAGISVFAYKYNTKYVPLYPTKMTDNDVQEASAVLTQLRIDHNITITNDGIELPPSQKVRAQAALADNGLPRSPILTREQVVKEGGIGKTVAEQEAIRKQLLEGEITMAFRSMEGINDAQVILAIPRKSSFRDDNVRTTASIRLNLKPEAQVTRDKVKGMVNMVAASVPELRPEDVNIIDTNGTDITAMLPKEGDVFAAGGSSMEIQASEELRLQKKAQEALDRAYPNKTKVSVNLDMDFSKIERESFTPGGAADDGVVTQSRQIKREVLDRSGNAKATGDGATQASTGNGKKDGGDYTHEVESVNNLVKQDKVKTVDTGFRVKRLTCAVLSDNLSENDVTAIAGFVSDAIGIDPQRGDKVTVSNTPWDHAMAPPVGQQWNALPAVAQEQASGVPAGTMAMVAAAGSALMLVVLGLFLIKQHGVRSEQGTIISSAAGSITSTSITDHFTDKSGKTTAPMTSAGATQVNTTDQLEQLVKERPTKVAEMLKSTWLS